MIDQLDVPPPPPSPWGDDHQTQVTSEDLEGTVTEICRFCRFLSQVQIDRITRAVIPAGAAMTEGSNKKPPPAVVYDASFSLLEEVQAQVIAVRAVRNQIIEPNGTIKPDISTREAKEVVSSGSTLLNTLMKFHPQIMNMDRQLKLETSIIEVLSKEGKGLKDKVMKLFEDKFEEDDLL